MAARVGAGILQRRRGDFPRPTTASSRSIPASLSIVPLSPPVASMTALCDVGTNGGFVAADGA